MTISYRQLIKWRKEALHDKQLINHKDSVGVMVTRDHNNYIEKVLKLTQELIDQHLIRRKG